MSYQDDNPADSQADRDRYDDRYQEDRDRDERQSAVAQGQPRPASNRGCWKGCFIGMAGCGCLTFLVIGAVGLGIWKMAAGFSVDPAVIRAATAQIAEVEIPAGLEPTIKIDALLANGVFYQSKDRRTSLSLLQFNRWLAQMAGEEGRGFRREDDDPRFKRVDLKIEKTAEKPVKIRGQMAPVKFSEAKNPEGIEYRIVEGEFDGKAGLVQFKLEQPFEDYDEAEVIKFLESIK